MPRASSDFTALVKEGADELRGTVEKALAERPMLVLGLALELGLIAGHWVRGGKVPVADIAKRAFGASPQALFASVMGGGKKSPRRRASTRRAANARAAGKTAGKNPGKRRSAKRSAAAT